MSNKYVDLEQLDKYNLTSFVKDCYLIVLKEAFRENPGVFHWDPDPEITKIHIADRFEYPKDAQTFRPTVYLTRGRMGFGHVSINQFAGGNLNTGQASHKDLIQGSMLVNCVSSEGLESEHLAGLVFILLQALNRQFNKLGFHYLRVGEIMEERMLESKVSSSLVEVSVSTAFSFTYNWVTSIMNSSVLSEVCIQRSGPDGSGSGAGSGSGSGSGSDNEVFYKDPCDDTNDKDGDGCNDGCDEFGPIKLVNE